MGDGSMDTAKSQHIESGSALVEFALLVALISITSMAALQVFGGQVKEEYCSANYAFYNAHDGGTSGTGLPGPGSLEYECHFAGRDNDQD